MFEIIMLFAFLGAATSQFLPADPGPKKSLPNKKNRHCKDHGSHRFERHGGSDNHNKSAQKCRRQWHAHAA